LRDPGADTPWARERGVHDISPGSCFLSESRAEVSNEAQVGQGFLFTGQPLAGKLLVLRKR
jgi:hypothetical protein